MLDLLVLNGSRAGARFALREVPAVLGRSPEAHLRLDDPWISNMHALFEARGAELWVVDLGSRNGTFVDRQRVEEARIEAGAHLAFGRTEVRLEPSAPGSATLEHPTRTPALLDPATLTARTLRPTPYRTPASGPEDTTGDETPPPGPRRGDP